MREANRALESSDQHGSHPLGLIRPKLRTEHGKKENGRTKVGKKMTISDRQQREQARIALIIIAVQIIIKGRVCSIRSG